MKTGNKCSVTRKMSSVKLSTLKLVLDKRMDRMRKTEVWWRMSSSISVAKMDFSIYSLALLETTREVQECLMGARHPYFEKLLERMKTMEPCKLLQLLILPWLKVAGYGRLS